MRTLQEVCAEIRAIETIEALIEFLKSKGVAGVPRDGDHCPLANYLRQQTGRDYKVSDDIGTDGELASGCAYAAWENLDDEGEMDEHRVPLCNVANTFIGKFDKGEIPELIAP